MTGRQLETTREMCHEALEAAGENSLDRWLAMDALAAHDLRDVVKGLVAMLGDSPEEAPDNSFFERAKDWVDAP